MNNHWSGGSCGCLLLFPEIQGHCASRYTAVYRDLGVQVMCSGKKESLDFMEDYIQNHPGLKRYRFMLAHASLNGDDLTKEDLDVICRMPKSWFWRKKYTATG